MSWTKAPVPEQASQVNEQLRILCFNAYLRPTFYLHTTFYGITMQAERTEQGKLRLFGTDLQREHAREVLDLAHLLVVQVIDVLNTFFKLGKEEQVAAVAKG
jgi:hypothetical protein